MLIVTSIYVVLSINSNCCKVCCHAAIYKIEESYFYKIPRNFLSFHQYIYTQYARKSNCRRYFSYKLKYLLSKRTLYVSFLVLWRGSVRLYNRIPFSMCFTELVATKTLLLYFTRINKEN